MIIFIAIEAVCLPEGHLEPKRKVNVFANMPKEVAIITLMSFVFVLTFQLFSSNVSLLVVGRGFGGTVEAGLASTARWPGPDAGCARLYGAVRCGLRRCAGQGDLRAAGGQFCRRQLCPRGTCV